MKKGSLPLECSFFWFSSGLLYLTCCIATADIMFASFMGSAHRFPPARFWRLCALPLVQPTGACYLAKTRTKIVPIRFRWGDDVKHSFSS